MLSNPGLPDCRAVQALSAAFCLQDATSRIAVGIIAPVRRYAHPEIVSRTISGIISTGVGRTRGRRARYKADQATAWPRFGREGTYRRAVCTAAIRRTGRNRLGT